MTELGDVYLSHHQPDLSVRFYRDALRLEPFYLYPRFQLAQFAMVQGQKQEAARNLNVIQKILDARLPADSDYNRRLLSLPARPPAK